jgi:selenocysteine lyase/cysteine desulfurase
MLDCQKELFSLDAGVHYLNCAYMSPLLKTVEEAGTEGLIKKRNPYKVLPGDYFNDAAEVRTLFGKLVNADAGRVALVPSVSYGMGIVARNIKAGVGKKIITVHEEFPSDVYSLHRICGEHQMQLITIRPPEDPFERGKRWNEKIVEAIDRNTALINLSSIHWADGTLFDLESIGNRAKEVGALFVVDGTQSVGAMPFDVNQFKVDVLICAGYKWLLGPYTSGFIYLGEYFDNGIPIEESWLNRVGSDNFRELVDYQEIPAYRPLAARYNMGEFSNFINLPMQKVALSQLLDWTPLAISQYCSLLTGPFTQTLMEKGFWLEEEGYRANHLFGCRLPAHLSLDKVQQKLIEKKVFVSFRGNVIRISPHVYNDARDMEQLVSALCD